jgi:HD superfamily phosphohydrolase
LSFSYTQFPSSTHSRLSHCLGVARNIERALTAIFDRGVYYKVGESSPRPFPDDVMRHRNSIVQKAKLVALLHDLGHGPFGHALDNYIGFSRIEKSNPDPDKLYTARYIMSYLAPTLKSLGFDPQQLVTILDPTERFQLSGTDALIGELIDSALDVDRMDFLIRDAHATGLSMGFTNADALIEGLRPVLVDDGYSVAFDEGAVAYMEHFLYAREAMYRACYEHPRKRAAERIFERVVKEVAKDESWVGVEDDVFALADEEILCALRLCSQKSRLVSELLEQLLGDLDYVVVHDVWIGTEGTAAASWTRGVTKGRTGDLKLRYIEQPKQWEESIAVESGIGLDRVAQIQVIVPSPSAYQPRFNAARVLLNPAGPFKIGELFKVASHIEKVLKEMNPARARIKVMCASSFTPTEREKLKEAAVKELEGQDGLKTQSDGDLL